MNYRARLQRIAIRLAALLFILSCTAPLDAAARCQTTAQAPELVIESTRHSFGDAFAGETLFHSFPIRNNGNRPLELSDKIPIPRTSIYRPQDDRLSARPAGFTPSVRSRSASPT